MIQVQPHAQPVPQLLALGSYSLLQALLRFGQRFVMIHLPFVSQLNSTLAELMGLLEVHHSHSH